MKTTFRLIILAFAASITALSCTKENPVENGTENSSPQATGTRVITASFGASTKTTLDGFTPKFVDGDEIYVANEYEDTPEVCTISIDGSGKATFTTSLLGDLYAVYPASLAVPPASGEIVPSFQIPAVQTGKFSDANIAMAEITEGDNDAAKFYNVTSILKFYVDASIGVKSITVTNSAANIAYDSKTVTVDPTGDATIDTVTDDPNKRICYISIGNDEGYDINTKDLKFTSVTTTQGTVTRTLTANKTLEISNIYKAFIPYYIDLGDAGRWSYCNIGAFLPEETGRYFAWGDVTGQTWNGSTWSNGGFYSAPSISDDTLPSDKDAASANWGADWRMPVGGDSGEFKTLKSNTTYSWTTDYNGTGVSGYVFTGTGSYSGNSLFFPASGSGFDSAHVNEGSRGLYWSNTVFNTDKAYGLYFDSSSVTANFASSSRSYGLSVRPVYSPLPPEGALTGKFSVSADKKVYFSKGNLRYTISSSTWSFYDNQYDRGGSMYEDGHNTEISLFTWGYNATQSINPNGSDTDNVSRTSGVLSQTEDWGSQMGDGETWRTLTFDEWKYLLASRTNASSKIGYATVGGKVGFIILPDSFTDPYKNNGSGAFVPKASTGWTQNVYTAGENWDAMESAGAVFLPAAGTRNSAVVNAVDTYGAYWSSSLNSATNAYDFLFMSESIYYNYAEGRDNGFSVRLVADVK